MIDCMIFSKDRSMELNSLLTSLKDNFDVFDDIKILYKYSNDDFRMGYEKLFKKDYGLKFTWILESNFVEDTKRIIKSFDKKLCLTFVDDEFLIRKADKNIISKILENENISGFSLRLGDSFKYTWNAGINNEIPNFEYFSPYQLDSDFKDIIMWEWNKTKSGTDYGYPYCLNSMIRRTKEFQEVINKSSFSYPNDLEMAIVKNLDKNKEFLAAYKQPCSFLNCLNVSQTHFISRNINQEEFKLDALNKKWMEGYELNFRDFYNNTQECPTKAVEMKFIKGE